MIETKYLIIFAAIVCIIIFYYYYGEISSIKKILKPSYQKTMSLESRIIELEKKAQTLLVPKKNGLNDINNFKSKKNDSPALSITYQSDMIKNGNLSVRYADLSESETRELRKNMTQQKIVDTKVENKVENNLDDKFVDGECELSEIDVTPDTDTINVKIFDIIRKTPTESFDSNLDNKEYQQLLNSLSDDRIRDNIFNDDMNLDIYELTTGESVGNLEQTKKQKNFVGTLKKSIFDDADTDAIKTVSESGHITSIPSPSILSDLDLSINIINKNLIKTTPRTKKLLKQSNKNRLTKSITKKRKN